MSRSFSFKWSIWQVNPGSQCQKKACRKGASGNTLHAPSYSMTHYRFHEVAALRALMHAVRPLRETVNMQALHISMKLLLHVAFDN